MSGGVRGDARKRTAEQAAASYDLADDMCPNCVTPWKCNGPHESPADQLGVLEAAADAAYERFMAAASYYSAASDAHVAASSALAAALIEHQEKP